MTRRLQRRLGNIPRPASPSYGAAGVGVDAALRRPAGRGFAHDFSRVPVCVRRHETSAFKLNPVAAALPFGREDDPIHRPLLDRYRRETGLPLSGRDEFGRPVGPSDAEIKYVLSAPRLPSVYALNFVPPAIPATPDHSRANPGPPGTLSNLAGYTRVTLGGGMAVTWGRGAEQNGRVPIHLTRVEITYRLDPVLIQVSSRYAETSCPYRVTLAHELAHAEAFTQLFHGGRPALVRALAAHSIPTSAAPQRVPAGEAEAAQTAVEQGILGVVQAHRRQLRAEMEADRDAKDSPASYATEYAQCPREQW